jgi:outer membrane protein OmpA-like peptidoglycan-associated protein
MAGAVQISATVLPPPSEACAKVQAIADAKSLGGLDPSYVRNLCRACILEAKQLFPDLVAHLWNYVGEALRNNRRLAHLYERGGAFFATKSVRIAPEGKQFARSIADFLGHEDRLLSNRNLTITIYGFADQPDREGINMKLSEERAGGIRALLIKYGVSPARITCVSRGFTGRADLPFSIRVNGSEPWLRSVAIRFEGTVALGSVVSRLERLSKKVGVKKPGWLNEGMWLCGETAHSTDTP